MPKPPTVVDLRWQHDLAYEASSGTQSLIVDGDGRDGPSPVQMLGISLAGCMSVDLAHILAKGRHPFRGIRSQLVTDRAQEDPRRVVRMTLRFTVEGDVSPDTVDRAIALSREKYCSVWHSMRQDIDFTTAYDVQP
jgi:putative redox protein